MAFFYAAKVLFSLYEKEKSFLSETFFYTCEMVLPFWTFFASSNESVSCLAMCWVVHSSKREEILFINHKIKRSNLKHDETKVYLKPTSWLRMRSTSDYIDIPLGLLCLVKRFYILAKKTRNNRITGGQGIHEIMSLLV